jgi:hypothetical protein
MDWIDVSQDRDQWRALMNTVMNLRVYKMLKVIEWPHSWWLLKKASAL